jgi:hypothetical protein
MVPAQAQSLAAQRNFDVSAMSAEQGVFAGINWAFLRPQHYGDTQAGFRNGSTLKINVICRGRSNANGAAQLGPAC